MNQKIRLKKLLSHMQPYLSQCRSTGRLYWHKLRARCQPGVERLLAWWRPHQKELLSRAKPYLEKFQARWQSLNQRERYSVLGGGSVTALLLFYAFLWCPLTAHLDDLRLRIQAEKKTAAWVKAVNKQLQNLEERQPKSSVKQLSRRINLVQEDLQRAVYGKSLTLLTQTAPDEIRAAFDKVQFDEFIAWLMTFTQDHRLIVKEAGVKRLNNLGLVQVEVVFLM